MADTDPIPALITGLRADAADCRILGNPLFCRLFDAADALTTLSAQLREVAACRYCGQPLLADGEGGWSCARRLDDGHHTQVKIELPPLPEAPDSVPRSLEYIWLDGAKAYREKLSEWPGR